SFARDWSSDVCSSDLVGDPSRHNPPRYKDESAYFQSVNGGKRSLTINLNVPNAKELVRRLIAHSDVMMESFSASVAAKHSIDARSEERRVGKEGWHRG